MTNSRVARVVQSPRGFTLVELLVVIAIIGILVSLLVPAVNAAREAGRMTQCKNNLRQIGMAFNAHLEAFQVFPGGGYGVNGPRLWASTTPHMPADFHKAPSGPLQCGQTWGWAYQILPYMDNQALFNNPSDSAVYGTPIASYFCSSRRRPTVLNGRAMIDYAANGGTTKDNQLASGTGTRWGDGADGIVGHAQYQDAISAAQIKDGLSNTILAGEKRMNDTSAASANIDDLEGYVAGFQDDSIRWGPNQQYNGETLTPHLDMSIAPDQPLPRAWEFGSVHATGAHFVFCDGAARLIRYSVDADVFAKACCRDDQKFYPGQDPTYDLNSL